MANPRRPGRSPTGAGTEPPPIDPIDPEELRQIRMLAEAALVSFSAEPNPVVTFTQSRLAWNISMPTTVIPGVHVEVHLHDGTYDRLIDPQGSQVVVPYGNTSYSIYLKTPLASRHLGAVELNVDLEACEGIDIAAGNFTQLAKTEADKAFPGGGQVTQRGDGISIDFGFNSFVVDIPLEIEVPNWRNANVDVALGFEVVVKDGQIRVANSFASTEVSMGIISTLGSLGCAAVVAKALEAQADAFLNGFVGPEIARRIAVPLNQNVRENLQRLDASQPSAAYRLYDSLLTDVGLTYRLCPSRPISESPTNPPLGGGNSPVIG